MRPLSLAAFVLVFGSIGACSSEDTPVDAGEQDSARADAQQTDSATIDAADSRVGDDTNVEDSATADSATADSALADSLADSGVIDSMTLDSTAPDSAMPDSSADSGGSSDASADAGARKTLFADFCPSTVTAPGLYRGSLASNTNDISAASGGTCLVTAPGRDGAVRVELDPGQTVRAVYRHAGDGVVYILDSCPVTSTCLAGADAKSTAGEEIVQWKNTGSARNPVYVVLDSASLSGTQTFELDLYVTGP